MRNILFSIIILICVIPSREISAQSVRTGHKKSNAELFDGYKSRDPPSFHHELSVKDLKLKRPGAKTHRRNKNGIKNHRTKCFSCVRLVCCCSVVKFSVEFHVHSSAHSSFTLDYSSRFQIKRENPPIFIF